MYDQISLWIFVRGRDVNVTVRDFTVVHRHSWFRAHRPALHTHFQAQTTRNIQRKHCLERLTNMDKGYKTDKEAFVSGMTGSSIMHVNLVSLVALVRPSHLHTSISLHIIAQDRPLSAFSPQSKHDFDQAAPSDFFHPGLFLSCLYF